MGASELFDRVPNEHKNFRLRDWDPAAVARMQQLAEALRQHKDSIPQLVASLEACWCALACISPLFTFCSIRGHAKMTCSASCRPFSCKPNHFSSAQVVDEEVHDLQQAGMFMAAGGLTVLTELANDDAAALSVRAAAAVALGTCVQRYGGVERNAWLSMACRKQGVARRALSRLCERFWRSGWSEDRTSHKRELIVSPSVDASILRRHCVIFALYELTHCIVAPTTATPTRSRRH